MTPELPGAALLWAAAPAWYVGERRIGAARWWALSVAVVLASTGTWAVWRAAASTAAALAGVVGHLTAVLTLVAIVVPFLRARRLPRPGPRGALRVGPGSLGNTYSGKVFLASVVAPSVALGVSIAVPVLVPASQDVRYLTAILLVVPAMAVAPVLVLLAEGARRAWVVTAACAVATIAAVSRAWP